MTEQEEPKTVEGSFEADTVIIQPELPMSVAFIGAPGVGKASVAGQFIDLVEPWLKAQDGEIVYIPNAGSTIEEEYDIAMGQVGGYRENLWTFFHRLEKERQAQVAGKSYVTSGTVLEALAHSGVGYEITMLGADSGIVTSETQAELQKIQVTMTMLTFLFVDNFRYKFVFYIPRTENVIIPGQDETPEQRLSRRVDAALQEIFRNFQLRVQVLDQPTNEERAKVAFETIKTIYEEGIEVPKDLAPEGVL